MLRTGEQPDLPRHLSKNHGETPPNAYICFSSPAMTLPGQNCCLHFMKGYGL